MTPRKVTRAAWRRAWCHPVFVAALLAATAAADDSKWQEAAHADATVADGATIRDGGPMVFNGGGPGRNGGNNFSGLAMADDFALGSPTTIESIRLWSLGFGSQWGGSGVYRIYADGGGTPGTLLASGSLVNVSTAFTGVVPFGFTESEHVSNLVPPPTLGAGTYWIALQSGDPCDASQQRIWETTTTSFGAFARRTNDFQCGETPSINMGFNLAFQLFGTHPPLVFDGGHSIHTDARGMTHASVAENFQLTDHTSISAIRMWTGETAPWDGSGTYRIHSAAPGSPPGPIVASGNLLGVSRSTTGITVDGLYPEFEHYSLLDPPAALPPGNYWINVRNASPCAPGGTLFWVSGNEPGGGEPARETGVGDCGGFYAFNTGQQLAFQLFGDGFDPPCVDCGDATVIENEPNCGAPDTVNGGCNSSPNVYQPISIGDVVCGTGRSTTGSRDTDWYGFTVAVRSQVTWSVQTDAPNVQLSLLSRTCPASSFANQGFTPASCDEVSVSATLDPGNYAAFVGYQAGEIPCGTPYKARLTAVPIDPCQGEVDPPTALCVAPLGICLDADGTATIGAVDIDNGSFDDCGAVSLSIDRDSFDCDDIGTPVVVTLTVTDGNNNTSQCQTTVTVDDCTPPTITNCPGNFSVPGTAGYGYDLDYVPTIDDNCGATYEISPPNPLPFGTTTVTVTATDAGGNTDACFFDVTVTAPTCFDCGDATVVEDEPGCGLPFDSTNGGCTSTPPGVYQQIQPGDVICGTGRVVGSRDVDWYSFTLAERSVVTWSARCDLGILQLALTTKTCPPVQLALQSGDASNCTTASVTATLDPGDYSCLVAFTTPGVPCGTKYKATLTAVPDDPCAVDDDPPTAACVAPFSLCLDETGQAGITADDIDSGSFDDCGDVELSIDRDSFDCSDLGTPVVVTLTVTDESDNVSTCQTTVTVEDCQDPVINNCPSGFTTTCNTQGGYDLDFTPTVTDNCGWTYEVSPPNPVPFGTNVVTVTVTDAGGNTDECSFEVTVVPEVKDPWRAYSIPAEDGWVRETDFVNLIEGPVNSKAQTLDVGDDAQNWGRRGILSFDTSGIPASATITGARIRLTRASLTGNVSGLGSLVLDMAAGGASSRGGCSGFINAATLESADYHETETLALDVASSFPAPGGNGFTTFVEIDPAYFDLLDRNCRTQFRFGFATESDDDGTADYIAFHSGEAGVTVRPELIVEYYDDSCTPCAPGLGCAPVTVTLWSTAPEDGGLMESHWTSGVGGTASAGAASSPVGDTSQRQQLQVLLNFDTSSIPVDAVVTSAELRVYRSSATGGWAAFGPLLVGMRNPCSMPWWYGGSGALEAIDFQAFSPVVPAGSLTIPASNTYTSTFLNPAGLAAINRGGPTQMKLFFASGDDGDSASDQVQIATGNYGPTSPGRPRLVVTYESCAD